MRQTEEQHSSLWVMVVCPRLLVFTMNLLIDRLAASIDIQDCIKKETDLHLKEQSYTYASFNDEAGGVHDLRTACVIPNYVSLISCCLQAAADLPVC